MKQWTQSLNEMKKSLAEDFSKEIKNSKEELLHDMGELKKRIETVENNQYDTTQKQTVVIKNLPETHGENLNRKVNDLFK